MCRMDCVHWLYCAHRAVQMGLPKVAVLCLRKAMGCALRNHQRKRAGHILCAINVLKRA